MSYKQADAKGRVNHVLPMIEGCKLQLLGNMDFQTSATLSPLMLSVVVTGLVLFALYYVVVLTAERIPQFDAPVVSHKNGFLEALKEGKTKVRPTETSQKPLS